jgi:hypothetical protein
MKTACSAALAALVFLVAGQSIGRPGNEPFEHLTTDELKRLYLQCSATSFDRLGSGGVAYCSVAYEELKRRAFGGDFAKLLAWSRTQPDAPEAASPPSPVSRR